MAGHAPTDGGTGLGSPAGRIAREVSALQASLLAKLRQELQPERSEEFALTAERLAADFGSVTATAVDAAYQQGELASLYQPGHMRRRLEQLIETHRRYGHPFAVAVFDASGPDTRNGDGAGAETVLAIVGAALRDSIRIVDEAFHLEEDAICVLAPNLRTVEAVQMAERLLGQLEDLERAGGLRIEVAAGVAACPEHGADIEQLLHKADAAMWRARALGQPVGVGALEPVQDR
ncbi:MAG TPA: GGDEF domain-containing protein [Solirubrobacterales bacterium]|nr:GGDEF domain-containing protein [Solirubrobacterales bacterium]